jgi:type IV pilus assembly protein PilW
MSRATASHRRQAGVTLIELMVALVLGLMLSGVVFGVLTTFEGRKRTLTAGNDIEQAGQLAMYKIDHWIRSAGAALPQAANFAYGCPLHAARSGRQLLPRDAAIAAPFDKVDTGESGVFRLAPVLILPGQTKPSFSGETSDALVLLAGVPNGGVVAPFTDAASAATLNLDYAGDFAGGDLALVVDQPDDTGARRPCLLTQVDSSFNGAGGALPLKGAYHADRVGNASIAGYTDSAFALRLGTAAGSGAPQFLLLGVGDANVLYTYDLLQTATAPLQAQADGVFEMHALYGVDSNGDGKVDRWVSPAAGDYGIDALTAGDQVAAERLQQIMAIRVGLLMRTSLSEKDEVTTGPLTLFPDLGQLAFSRTLSDKERHFRYRTIEQTVPVRNNLLIKDE